MSLTIGNEIFSILLFLTPGIVFRAVTNTIPLKKHDSVLLVIYFSIITWIIAFLLDSFIERYDLLSIYFEGEFVYANLKLQQIVFSMGFLFIVPMLFGTIIPSIRKISPTAFDSTYSFVFSSEQLKQTDLVKIIALDMSFEYAGEVKFAVENPEFIEVYFKKCFFDDKEHSNYVRSFAKNQVSIEIIQPKELKLSWKQKIIKRLTINMLRKH